MSNRWGSSEVEIRGIKYSFSVAVLRMRLRCSSHTVYEPSERPEQAYPSQTLRACVA
jgi:hypothetical protein